MCMCKHFQKVYLWTWVWVKLSYSGQEIYIIWAVTTKHISKTIGDDADADAGGFQQHKSLSEEPTQQI